MCPLFEKGSLKLFRLFGVNVYLHWSWLLGALAFYWIRPADSFFNGRNHAFGFYTALYLCLFLIVLLHEFGHALACKSVGGKADRIILWPLGGLAFVRPPARPGATLWSIAAGPLVNVILLPLTLIPAAVVSFSAHKAGGITGDFLVSLAFINLSLLIFNMLPVYPLDGGQILRSLLWFLFGKGTSLIIASIIGLIGATLLLFVSVFFGGTFTIFIALFMGFSSYSAIRYGLMLQRIERSPRRPDVKCPRCGDPAPIGPYWGCPCGGPQFDPFANGGRCPTCERAFQTNACPNCETQSPINQWQLRPPGHPFTYPTDAPLTLSPPQSPG